jgi:hypothetical protein
VHPELEAASAPVLRDLAASDLVPTVVDEEWQDFPGTASLMLYGSDAAGTGVWITLGRPFPEQVVELADQVQEWAVEALWTLGRPATWPECPHHRDGHPLTARLDAGTAAWTCPSLGRRVGDIGALP